MALFKKDPFGHTLFVKRWLIRVFGLITHSRYDGFNQLKIEGSDIIRSLPPQNVLFISNHQTYFADVTAMYHVFNASLKGRKWREKGKEIHREVRQSDVENIGIALADGWVITFPQGTTSPWKPIRKGTAHLIKQYKPIVVPIVIDGFRRSFDKKGINIKKKGVQQSMIIKPPLQIDYENDTVEQIVAQIEMAIEQHESFLKVRKLESDNALQVESKQ